MNINNLIRSINKIRNYDIKNLKNVDIKSFYEKNRQKVLMTFIIITGVFFLFYWTGDIISNKIETYEANAKQTYERLEKANELSVQMKLKENRLNTMQTGLLTFLQKTGADTGISQKIANIRALPGSTNVEHVSMRFESLYYDEFIQFTASVEKYDNLWIKAVSFTRRYNNPNIIDVTMEIVKS